MHFVDWLIVLCLNGGIIALGFYLARGTSTSGEWFLGNRALPWWAIGISMFATNVDNADLVGVTGQTYVEGIHIITVYALASAIGGILAAFFIVPAIYRAGFYTNAEYLEARFGTSARVISALIQIQYRSSMLGMMIWSAHLLLTRLIGIDPAAAWLLIVGLVILSGLYTAWGGLKSVVWTDAAQGIVMILAALVIFGSVWHHVGGWSNLQDKLEQADVESKRAAAESRLDAYNETDKEARDEKLAYAKKLDQRYDATELARISNYRGDKGDTLPLFIAFGWIIIGSGYWTVNHTQTMRLMGARSLWDMKMAALFGVLISLPIMLASVALGLFGRAFFPTVNDPDTIYPTLAATYLAVGLKGMVVAGVVAAVISTFDSMGSALSAVFTRDIYARLLVRTAGDRHYVVVGRITTVCVLALGFLYLPFIAAQDNMLKAFTTLIPVFVTPLFTVYVVGIFTRAHRRSAIVGLICGSLYGVVALYDRQATTLGVSGIEWLPAWFTGRWIALSWSLLITAAAMLVTTLFCGTHPKDTSLTIKETGWLARSRESLPPLREHPFTNRVPALLTPGWYAIALLALTAYVVFGLFW